MGVLFSLVSMATEGSIWSFPTFLVASASLLMAFITAGLKLRMLWKQKHPFKAFGYHIALECRNRLTVGIGVYNVRFVLTARDSITIRDSYPRITFDGAECNKPQVVGSWRLVEAGIKKDAHQVDENDYRVLEYPVRTFGTWKGRVKVEFYVEHVGRVFQRLPFAVSISNTDDIPLLKA